MDILRVAIAGIFHPATAMDALKARPAPSWGLRAVLVRFIGASVFVTLPLALLGRTPFAPSCLTFIPDERYYTVLVFLLPVFGIIAWLLMSSCAHVALRLCSRRTDFDQIANVIGLSMLIPMPIVWTWDLAMIIAGTYGLAVMAISHSLFQVWEIFLGFLGLKRVLGLDSPAALGIAIAANLVYVLMGALFSR
jgi:hypothetical protein